MIYFEDKYFQKVKFDEKQIEQRFRSAIKDFGIAKKNEDPSVVFRFLYDAFIKLGITLISQKGYKVRSIAGHHVKILEQMSKILKNEDIAIVGNKMRQDRNSGLYDGVEFVSETQNKEYLNFIGSIFKQFK